MSMLPHLSILIATALLNSSVAQIPQYPVDLKMTSPDGVQRIDQLWLVTYVDDGGQETVAQAKLANGDYAPLIAADTARLESMMPAARGIAKANNIKMRLVRFTNRVDLEEIRP